MRTPHPPIAIVTWSLLRWTRVTAPTRLRDEFQDRGRVRKMKDAEGRFLWSDGSGPRRAHAPEWATPVLIAEDMPDIASDATAIAFRRFPRGLPLLPSGPSCRVLRDRFSAKPPCPVLRHQALSAARCSDYRRSN